MKSLLWVPITAVLLASCNDSTEKVTAPALNLPNSAYADLDKMAATMVSQAAVAPRCVQLRYISETGVIRSANRGSGCPLCGAGRPASVTAVIWNGAAGNNVIGRARCLTQSGETIVAGVLPVDPGGGLFGFAASTGSQGSGVPGCGISASVTNPLNRSNRLVTCIWQ